MKDWSNKTILVAEDDTINFNLLKIVLRPTNANILWAKNGLDAVNMFNDNHVHVVLMDIQMPVMDGHEASLKIREKDKDIPIIVISAYSSSDVRQKAKDSGANDFMNKPIRSANLLEIIDSYLS